MKYLSIVLIVLLASVAVAKDWQQELTKDIVTIKDNKMYIEAYLLLKTTAEDGTPNNRQVKIYCTCPATVMSRDNFVSMSTMFYTIMIVAVLNTADFEIEEIDEPIGNVDLEINLYMTKDGCQSELDNKDTNEKVRNTIQWSDLFGSE